MIRNIKEEVLNQYSKDLITLIKTKKLFLKPNFNLVDLSKEAGITVDEIKKVLSEKLQVTFFEFISKFKINEAKHLLINIRKNQFSISTIAAQSGFNTNDSFVTIFKKHTNMSPEEYRIKYFKIEPNYSDSFEN